MNKLLILFLIISIFIIILIFINYNVRQSATVIVYPTQLPEETPPKPAGEEVLKPEMPEEVIIEITSSSFTPSTVTINSGDKVTFVNKDSSQHQPASNAHPIHADYPGFDALRGLNQNQNYSFTFTRVETWGYHDHLNPSLTGKIIVR